MPRIRELSPTPGESSVADSCRERRGEGGLLSLDRCLLHNEYVADGWNRMMGAIRTRSTIPGDLRELLILRVAVLNGAEYEWLQHEQVARAEGCTQQHLNAIAKSSVTEDDFPAPFLAAFALTDASTKDVRISQEVFDNCRAFWSESEVQEIVMVIASYNMVSRYLVALDVGDAVSQPQNIMPIRS